MDTKYYIESYAVLQVVYGSKIYVIGSLGYFG